MILVKYETHGGRVCQVEVCEGTLGDKLRRGRMMQDIIRERQAQEGEVDVISALVELHTFPSCVSCAHNLEDSERPKLALRGMTFEQFCGFPGEFIEQWIVAVFEVNPGWRTDEGFPQMGPSIEPENNK